MLVVRGDTNVGLLTLITTVNCISVTMFISTYLFHHATLYLPETKVSCVQHWRFYHHHLLVSIPILLCPWTGLYRGLSLESPKPS